MRRLIFIPLKEQLILRLLFFFLFLLFSLIKPCTVKKMVKKGRHSNGIRGYVDERRAKGFSDYYKWEN